MASTFNQQILVEKLAKLNSSQQSIETLSHWCIFHMNKAKQVADTWERQFYCCPREQRLAFLYLANDILQNSRRKGSEFLGEFWRVLPNALRDVIGNGDDFGRKAALRLIGIWEDRKVFGSRGQILKEELVGRHLDNNNNRNGKQSSVKPSNSSGSSLDNIISSYNVVHQLEEDVISKRCRNAIGCIQKVDKEIGGNVRAGQPNGTAVEELKGQQAILRECIEQLTAVESSRASLVSHLREVLQEQELKLDQVRNQLQAARSQSEQAGNICLQLLNGNNVQLLAEQSTKVSGSVEQSTPVIYTRQVPFVEKPSYTEGEPKSAAAAVAAKLTSSTSSAQMLSYVLSSLASEGVIGNSVNESSPDFQSEKRQKLENDQSYIPSQKPQAPVAHFSHHESMQPTSPVTSQELTPREHPPPPSYPPPLPPLPPMQPYPVPQYMQTAGSMPGVPYGGYSSTHQHPPMLPSYTTVGPPLNAVPPFTPPPPPNGYQGFPGDSGFYSQPSSLPMAPLPRQ